MICELTWLNLSYSAIADCQFIFTYQENTNEFNSDDGWLNMKNQREKYMFHLKYNSIITRLTKSVN